MRSNKLQPLYQNPTLNDRKATQVNAALMHTAIKLLQDPPNPEGNTGYAPATANNSTQRTPTVATRTWHHTAMSTATFTLSALLAYVATEAIFKRIRGRN